MEGGGGGNKWKILRERLSFKGMTCCGGGIRTSSNMMVRDDDDQGEVIVELNLPAGETRVTGTTDQHNQACMMGSGQISAAPTSGMNLATALAAERQFRAQHEWVVDDGGGDNENNNNNSTTTTSTSTPPTVIPTVTPTVVSTMSTPTVRTPLRVSLMALLEEGEEGDGGGEKETRLCCVCMGRRKGAAFIPCGHTFCRVCSRELWLNRGSCPLCNRSILEILDIF